MTAAGDWFENEALWSELYPHLFPAERFDAAAGEIDQVLRLAAPPGDRVLDLCCGPGRHTVALAKRGLRATGVDRTPFLLAKAQERASQAGLGAGVEFVREDMRRFRRQGAFDLIVSMFSSFGYFDDPADDDLVLRHMHDCLRPDGAVFFEMASKEHLCAHFEETRSTQPGPDGAFLVQRHQILDDWTRVKNEWTLIKDGAARQYVFFVRIYSGKELKDRLTAAGFASVRLYGGLDGRPYDRGLQRLIAVARKT